MKIKDSVRLAGLAALIGSTQPAERQATNNSGYWVRKRDGHLIGPLYSKGKRRRRKVRPSSPASHHFAAFKKREKRRRLRGI